MLNYRVLHKSGGRAIIEYSPCKRTVSIGGKYYFLPFPYMVFASHKLAYDTNFYAWFTHKKFDNDLNQKLYMPFFPNIDYDGKVCLGEAFPTIISIEKLISSFWSRSFSSFKSAHVSALAITMLQSVTRETEYDECLNAWASLSTKKLISRLNNRRSNMKFSTLGSWFGVEL